MKLFKLRNKAHRLGFQILNCGQGWQVMNNGIKKKLSWNVNTLEEAEELLNELRLQLQKKERGKNE